MNCRLQLAPLSPVHIGSGETIEPYEYVIDDDGLHKVSLTRLLSVAADRDRRHLQVAMEQDLVNLRTQLAGTKHLVREASEYRIDVSDSVRLEYHNSLSDSSNALEISLFTRSVSGPIIPGSSVKGAIRTAVLYTMADCSIDSYINSSVERGSDIEKAILGHRDPADDPFRAVRVSDSYGGQGSTCVYSCGLYTKSDSGGSFGPKMHVECAVSYLLGARKAFSHDLAIDERLQNHPTAKLKTKLTPDDLLSSCATFYERVLDHEEAYFADSDIPEVSRELSRLKNYYKQAKEQGRWSLIRLGWGSGFDGVTLNQARGKPKQVKSRRLAEKRYPMGWAMIRLQKG